MHPVFRVMNTCLWYLDSGFSRHMTKDRTLFKVFKSKKGDNVTFGDGSKSYIKVKGIISLLGLPDIANVLYMEGLRVNLLSISQIWDQNLMVLFSKGKCLVLKRMPFSFDLPISCNSDIIAPMASIGTSSNLAL